MNDFKLKALSSSLSGSGVLNMFDKNKLLYGKAEDKPEFLIVFSHKDTMFLKLYTPSYSVVYEDNYDIDALRVDIKSFVIKSTRVINELLFDDPNILQNNTDTIDSLTFRFAYLISESISEASAFNLDKYSFEGPNKTDTFINVRKLIVDMSQDKMSCTDIYNKILSIDGTNILNEGLIKASSNKDSKASYE